MWLAEESNLKGLTFKLLSLCYNNKLSFKHALIHMQIKLVPLQHSHANLNKIWLKFSAFHIYFRISPLKFNCLIFLYFLSSSPNLLINLPDRNNPNPQIKYTLYLWPRSKVWIRALKRMFKPPRLKSQI